MAGNKTMHRELAHYPEGHVQALRRQISGLWVTRRRAGILLSLCVSLALCLLWLPPASRFTLIISLLANRSLVVLLLLFSLLALSLLWSRGELIDKSLFGYFNVRGYRPPWMDRLMWLTTQVGSMGFAAIIAVLSYLLGDTRFAVLLMLGVLSLWLVVEAVKALTDRARPFKALEMARLIGWRERGRSFPSGHTSQAFFVASLFIHHHGLEPTAAAIVYGVAALVGVTRIYVGVHYPRDVLAGAFLGLVWGILSALVPPYL